MMIDPDRRERLKQNWERVEDEVLRAAEGCGRSGSSVKTIGVSKYVDAETTLALVQAGCHDLGESRPQSLWKKAESLALDTEIRWHLIGHLQRNKVRRLLHHRPVIHSIDSQRLLLAVAEESASQDLQTSVLLEVNISGDEAKTGFRPQALAEVLISPPEGIRVIGLMAMAGWGTDRDDARRQFEKTRELRDQLQQQGDCLLPELSMGMSGDFREAIAAGATMVRIGSRLFEGVIDRS
jgi:hypothetical protein